MKKIFIEGNQIHNFMSSSGTVINYGSGSDFLTNYGSGSGSTSQKVTVLAVPVPVPQHCRIRKIQILIRQSEVRIRGSGSVPKCHGPRKLWKSGTIYLIQLGQRQVQRLSSVSLGKSESDTAIPRWRKKMTQRILTAGKPQRRPVMKNSYDEP